MEKAECLPCNAIWSDTVQALCHFGRCYQWRRWRSDADEGRCFGHVRRLEQCWALPRVVWHSEKALFWRCFRGLRRHYSVISSDFVQAPMRNAIFGRCCRLPSDTVTTSFQWWLCRSDDGSPCNAVLGVVDDWRRWRRFGVVWRSQKAVLDAVARTVPMPFKHHWWRCCWHPLKRWKWL